MSSHLIKNDRDPDDADSDGGDVHRRKRLRSSSSLPPGVSESHYKRDLYMDHPPPGLVRVTAPVILSDHEYQSQKKAQVRVLDQYDVSLFSDIVHYFDTGLDVHGKHVIINIPCQICGDAWLEMPPAVSTRMQPEEKSKLEPMAVLPCGHFFGARCMDRWIRTRRSEELVPDCPVCRLPLAYEECGHHVQIRHYDARFPRSGQLPLTLPEGGIIPYHCQGCRVEWIQFLGEQLAGTLYPREIPEEAFTDLSESGPGNFKQLRSLLRSDVLNTFFHTEQKFSHW
ncbi:hypothetical protein F5Y05DRAFT_420711 [Hypoxylon sp. FL0543]|nr:hypothetical protein F5Y05DRAFT_420711 [Hypoxylon sp. FL0543]